jgi:hypothetical protein
MKTAHLGRRLGDWLGIVPEDDVPAPSTVADYFDLDRLDRMPQTHVESVVAQPARVEPTVAPEVPAPSPVPFTQPKPEPAKNVRTFRDVVNQRRADAQRRAQQPQAPPRW